MSRSEPLDPAFLVGKTIQNTYTVEELVGEGGMAFVYRAMHNVLETQVALKIMRREYAMRELYRERFLREAKIQYRLHHPHIVRVLDFLQDRGLVGCVLEWCNEGELNPNKIHVEHDRLYDVIHKQFLPLLDALEQIHQQGYIHRDLKPQNILVQTQDERTLWKISDFGLLKDVHEEARTHTGMIMGTFRYISPEQFQESKHVDKKTDIYSMGVVLYQLLLGRVPFTGKMPRLAIQIMEQQPPFPPDFPAPFQSILEKALAKNPNHRFDDARSFQEELINSLHVLNLSDEHLAAAPVPSQLPEVMSQAVWTEPSLPIHQPTWTHPPPQTSRKGTWFVVVLITLMGVLWFWLVQPTAQVSSSFGGGAIFHPKVKKVIDFAKHSYHRELLYRAMRRSEQMNWGHTRYFLRHYCKARQCYWYAHWIHHTLEIFQRGCEAGDKTSCHWLKKTTERKTSPLLFVRKAIPIYKKACRQQEPRACLALGQIGRSHPKLIKKPMTWVRQACQMRLEVACDVLKSNR